MAAGSPRCRGNRELVLWENHGRTVSIAAIPLPPARFAASPWGGGCFFPTLLEQATIVQSALILAQTARATEDHARRRLEADAGDADDVLTLSTIFKDDSDREVHGLKVLER